MGAHNTTPQTVRIENPQSGLGIQVTPSVVSSLVKREDKMENNQQQKQQRQFPCGLVEETPHNWKNAQDVFQRKYNELEQYHFDKSIEKVETMIGKPLAWVEDVNETITDLKQNLIKCYHDHPNQSLYCEDVAKKYHDFIYKEQQKAIMKSSDEYSDTTNSI